MVGEKREAGELRGLFSRDFRMHGVLPRRNAFQASPAFGCWEEKAVGL